MDVVYSDRACEACRRRRVKCDKRLPNCRRCELRGQPCTGYKSAQRFFDESSRIRRKYDSGRPPADQRRTNHCVGSDVRTEENDITTNQDPLSDRLGSTHEFNQSSDFVAPAFPCDTGGIPTYPDHGPEQSSTLRLSPGVGHQDVARLLQDQQGFTDVSPGSVWASSASEDDFFDLDIESYYANGNNACGFIPGVPVIMSDMTDSDYGSGNDYLTPDWTENDVHEHSSTLYDPFDRWREATVLMRHFVEVVSPWMDIFDLDAYFGRILPHKAKKSPIIRAAVAAVSAKQIAQMIENQSFPAASQNLHAISAELDDFEGASWYYKAANYYDAGISYLRVLLQRTDMGSPDTVDSLSAPDQQRCNPNRESTDIEDMLSTIAVFSLYEALNGYADEWTHHLAGFQSLLKSRACSSDLDDPMASPHNKIASVNGVRASFWSIAKADIMAAFVRQSRMQVDPQDMSIWNAAGLQMMTLDSSMTRVREDDICRTLVWIVSRVMNFLAANATEKTMPEWNELRNLLDQWNKSLPTLFQPYASVPVVTGQPNLKPRFMRELYSLPMCAAALQFYHFAQILLLMNRPMDNEDGISRLQAFRKVSEEANNHSRQICAIALGRNHPAASRQMIYPLYIAGSCFEEDEDRLVVLKLLKEIQRETGCTTTDRVEALLSNWGWDADRISQT